MRRTLEQLREKPRDEKTAIAASVSIGIVAILFIAWVVFFLHTIATTSTLNSQNNATNANDASSTQQEEAEQAYGSTTQFIQSSQGTIQLEEVSSSSEPSL